MSVVRVGIMFTSGIRFFSSATSFKEIASVMSFSLDLNEPSYSPTAPLSVPPWPASTIMVLIFLVVCASERVLVNDKGNNNRKNENDFRDKNIRDRKSVV